jgi:hypothetical protein
MLMARYGEVSPKLASNTCERRRIGRVKTVNTSSAVSIRGAALVLFLAASIGCLGDRPGTAPLAARLDHPPDTKATVIITGLTQPDLDRLERANLSADEWTAVLRVSVGQGQPAMVGSYDVNDGVLRFTPMFPLDPGRQYHVVFDGSRIPGSTGSTTPLVATVGLPASTAQPSTTVSHVFPTTDIVPENQLRLYIHFSAPMGLRGGLDYVTLVNERGETVEDPFLPLDTEFWNDDRTRYTVFFDPGRQKRGILPNKAMGRSLEPGHRYTLVVDREWRDANGLPLKDTFRREFRVGPADERPLDPAQWTINPPPAGSRDALTVTFPEPLDYGLLRRAMGVTRSGKGVDGDVHIDRTETQWTFTPAAPWTDGAYELLALGFLEDLAGNRIGRAFEVDQFDRVDRTAEPDRTTIPFRPRAIR